MNRSTDKPYLGRCKECDYALFADADTIQSCEDWRGVIKGEAPKRVGNYGVYARCTNGHKVFPLRQIKGKFSADHECDSRCLNAKGNDCTCSCGGVNHGRGHAVEVHVAKGHQASLDEVATPEPAKGVEAIANAVTRDADRHKGHVVQVEAEPTEPQLDLIKKLAERLAITPNAPRTRSAASDEINRLKALDREAQPQMTDSQRSFINRLMEQRSMPLENRQEARRQIDAGLTKYEASRWIDRLLQLPEIS
jgi:hypothetical protein